MPDFERLHKQVLQQFPETLAYLARKECSYCAWGWIPSKMKRQWIHHFPKTGQIKICQSKGIKQ